MNNQEATDNLPNEKDNMDALKALYDNRTDMKKFNMERSFITTLQTITLNILILGAYLGSKIQLTGEAKALGSFLLLAFNTFSIIYVKNKGDSHKKLRKEIAQIEDSLLIKCPTLNDKISGSHPGPNTFLKGSGILIFGIGITCICVVASFWMPLLINTKSEGKIKLNIDNLPVKAVTEQKSK
ncbi:MAG: hypothetical protein EOP45_06095 [Sphingobacteriaceae bacterium]|nr:MAG: hypothetical protein EOP45_06095 [Sphingobacteriaceae bacterium]